MINDPTIIPRFVPEKKFPAYAYVSGAFPHPNKDPAGHSFGVETAASTPLESTKWRSNSAYLYGIDLFNYGYYWEAHESWEDLWRSAAKDDVTKSFLKGLIKLAAAGVKVKEGKVKGVCSHGAGAKKMFEEVIKAINTNPPLFMGLDINLLLDFARNLNEWKSKTDSPVHTDKNVFGKFLLPKF